ncbi:MULTISPECIES: lipid-A-disaccharide synthase N-terminal domain-containing protein [unclassified Bacillus (in: firmicutes)]|uniref:lipid-A-disaccharide synthase N-terminal domain-containing protein n=1 Tax=Bacillaceae TaxID=186817 RepID=UPI000BF05AEF|nr:MULTISPECIES: lipid-A-disaccharide synthase N-terminal domain-containing protein [unclassified Bacillus (in: firmicutes)]PEJ60860.1 hypothetical protein CN692_01865 [Bacillus sp. AFS002410]PEL13481.1 hypothetical protein CN601_04880 [Bacillus sp. AFS017336]QKE73397.1 hypothetical protein HPK19_11540 [Arthrobacter citreus]
MTISTRDLLWITFGFIGQALFSLRFLTQWLASEKAKKTIIPFSFWVYSILGSIILSIYAIYRKDPVFILGQLPSVFVYIRNVMIYRGNNKKNEENKTSTLSG